MAVVATTTKEANAKKKMTTDGFLWSQENYIIVEGFGVEKC